MKLDIRTTTTTTNENCEGHGNKYMVFSTLNEMDFFILRIAISVNAFYFLY